MSFQEKSSYVIYLTKIKSKEKRQNDKIKHVSFFKIKYLYARFSDSVA